MRTTNEMYDELHDEIFTTYIVRKGNKLIVDFY